MQSAINQLEHDAMLGIMVRIGQNVITKEVLQKELENFQLNLQQVIVGQSTKIDHIEQKLENLRIEIFFL